MSRWLFSNIASWSVFAEVEERLGSTIVSCTVCDGHMGSAIQPNVIH